jgi:hypothetical protein
VHRNETPHPRPSRARSDARAQTRISRTTARGESRTPTRCGGQRPAGLATSLWGAPGATPCTRPCQPAPRARAAAAQLMAGSRARAKREQCVCVAATGVRCTIVVCVCGPTGSARQVQCHSRAVPLTPTRRHKRRRAAHPPAVAHSAAAVRKRFGAHQSDGPWRAPSGLPRNGCRCCRCRCYHYYHLSLSSFFLSSFIIIIGNGSGHIGRTLACSERSAAYSASRRSKFRRGGACKST